MKLSNNKISSTDNHVKTAHHLSTSSSSCYFNKKIIEFIDKELPSKLDHYIRKHLVKCAPCRAKLQQYEKKYAIINKLIPSLGQNPNIEGLKIELKENIRILLKNKYNKQKNSKKIFETFLKYFIKFLKS